MEGTPTLSPVSERQAEAAGSEPSLPGAPEGTGSARNRFGYRCEGHRYEIFFRARVIARDATRSSTAPGDRPCNGSVPMPVVTRWNGFWSASDAGVNDAPARLGPELWPKRPDPYADKSLPRSSGHIALGLSTPVSSACAQGEEGGARSVEVLPLRSLFFKRMKGVELEFHQLVLRYERLKVVRPEPERRLLASLAEVGQQVPIVVVKEDADGTFVVIDGYKRVRALRRLGRDTVTAGCWPGEEAEALIATRLMQTAEPETALEQSWLLAELHERFGLSLEELARRFSHSVSWVSRRLALVQELPECIQERVRRGEMGAHGAAKYLVPLARANREVCLELVEAIGATRLASRDLGILYTAYQTGNWVTRQRLLEAPLVFLKSYKEAQAPPAVEPGLSDSFLTDLEILSATARRADRRLRAGVLRNLPEKDRQDLASLLDQSRREIERLAEHFHQERGHAGPGHPCGDSEAARAGA
jgi:ParB/RepB/Spo0J family partition protein